MSEKQDWITAREEARMFQPGAGTPPESSALLEHSPTNRDITSEQGQLFSISRYFGKAFGLNFYKDFPDELEQVQASVDDKARHDYMKVAIEQWQGKLASAKKNVEALT